MLCRHHVYKFGSLHRDTEIGSFRVSRKYIHVSRGSNVMATVLFYAAACCRCAKTFSLYTDAGRFCLSPAAVFIKDLLFLVFRAVPEVGLVCSCKVSVVCCAALRVFSFPHLMPAIFGHAKGKKLYERASSNGFNREV